MSDLSLSRVTATKKEGTEPKAAPEADLRLIALPCPNKMCRRVFVMIAAKGTVRIKCRDCKTQATYEVDGTRVVSFHIDRFPKQCKRR